MILYNFKILIIQLKFLIRNIYFILPILILSKFLKLLKILKKINIIINFASNAIYKIKDLLFVFTAAIANLILSMISILLMVNKALAAL